MVRAHAEEQESFRSRIFPIKGMGEKLGRRKTHSLILDKDDGSMSPLDERIASRSQPSIPLGNQPTEITSIGSNFNPDDDNLSSKPKRPSDLELMKEKFAKLLLGEDMSGGRKGVSSALALSNAITNLAASVFGEQRRLEPMPADTKARWRREMDWLLSVTDYIVEFAPSTQQTKDGSYMEVMTTRQRTDLHMNIPALQKLDAMLIGCFDNFKDQSEYYNTPKDDNEFQKGKNKRNDDKWWLPFANIPPNGLFESTRRWLQVQKDSVNQVLKAALAINAQVLTEMEIPENYIESLPKNGKASLGELAYKSITDEFFDPDYFLSSMDLSTEHKILDLKNRMEASVVIWKRKMIDKHGKSGWSSAVSLEKREQLEERAETILLILKQKFPGIPQSALEISKIQYNKDVGLAILESYSRTLESLASTVWSWIEDVLNADSLAQSLSPENQKRSFKIELPRVKGSEKFPNAKELEKLNSTKLFNVMGWDLDEALTEEMKYSQEFCNLDAAKPSKLPDIVTATKKFSY